MIARGRGLRRAGRGRRRCWPARRMSISCSARRPITACPRWWRARARAEGAVLDTDFPAEAKFDFLPEPRRRAGRLGAAHRSRRAATSSAPSASCPIRAAPSSRGPAQDMLAEARLLVARGAREITLLGQNVNAYHGEAPAGGRLGPGPAGPRARRDRRDSRASATPPRTRAMSTTSSSPRIATCRSSCRSCICRCSRARTRCWRR